jgi:uncharacterized tellurite resistance protein B-like protein
MTEHYQLGLLYLVKLLIDADGIADEKELAALRVIKEKEQITNDVFTSFEALVSTLREQDVYNAGIAHLNQCNKQEKLNIFSMLYKLSEVDGRVHLKEIKLLLYSIKSAGISFDDVVTQAKSTAAFV